MKKEAWCKFSQKNINIWPPGIFENENFEACALKFWNWTSKIIPDLGLLDLFCPIKKKIHTPPYCTVQVNR